VITDFYRAITIAKKTRLVEEQERLGTRRFQRAVSGVRRIDRNKTQVRIASSSGRPISINRRFAESTLEATRTQGHL